MIEIKVKGTNYIFKYYGEIWMLTEEPFLWIINYDSIDAFWLEDIISIKGKDGNRRLLEDTT